MFDKVLSTSLSIIDIPWVFLYVQEFFSQGLHGSRSQKKKKISEKSQSNPQREKSPYSEFF